MCQLKTCRDCGQLKPEDEFSKEALRGQGDSWPRCLLCTSNARYVSQRVHAETVERRSGASVREREVATEYQLPSAPPVDDLERRVAINGRCRGDDRFRGTFHSTRVVYELRRICHLCPVKKECELLGERFDEAFVTGTARDPKTGRHLRVGSCFYAGRTPIERAVLRDRREKVGNRERLLELLGAGPKNGYELAAELGINPVSVKKLVKRMRDEGTDIRSKRGGGGGYWLPEAA